ncbi:hypothetical protein [Paractinoplanes maris]|uniref:hypothetical protein n=1 Tax=Paractinoplanes maris TaxID=1734446 RepID=UPI00201FC9BA|nr:hypothetical protein [Actinoplanes maris]
MTITKRPLAISSIALLAVASLSGCSRSDATGESDPTPTVVVTSTDTQQQDCGESAVTNTVSETGSLLQVTSLGFTASNGRLDFVLPAGIRSNYPAFRAGEFTGDSTEPFDRAIAEGAFIYGNPDINLFVENAEHEDIVVTDVRAVNTRDVCMPSGLLALLGTEGGDETTLAMNFDADRPIGMVPTDSGTVADTPYFDSNTIDIPSGEMRQILIVGTLLKRARTFELALTYIHDGAEYTQLIGPSDGPFRVTPSICPGQEDQAALEQEDVDRLHAHQFDDVLRRSDEMVNGHINLETVSTETYAQSCTG